MRAEDAVFGCCHLSVRIFSHASIFLFVYTFDFEFRLSGVFFAGATSFLAGELLSLSAFNGLCRVGRSFITAIGKTLVYLLQIRDDLVGIVGLPEFQVGTTLQEFTHTVPVREHQAFQP